MFPVEAFAAAGAVGATAEDAAEDGGALAPLRSPNPHLCYLVSYCFKIDMNQNIILTSLVVFCSCAYEAYKSSDWEAEVVRRSSCVPEEQRVQGDHLQIVPGKPFFILKASAILAAGCVFVLWELRDFF